MWRTAAGIGITGRRCLGIGVQPIAVRYTAASGRWTKEMQAMTQTPAEAPFTVTDGPQRHASYAALAATAPVHHIALPTGQLAWLITGYDEARRALLDPRLVKSELTAATTGRALLARGCMRRWVVTCSTAIRPTTPDCAGW